MFTRHYRSVRILSILFVLFFGVAVNAQSVPTTGLPDGVSPDYFGQLIQDTTSQAQSSAASQADQIPTPEELQQMQDAFSSQIQQQIDTVTEQQSLDSSFNIDSSPKYPAPNQDVTLTASDIGTNITTSGVYWYKDGVLVSSGIGDTTYTFKTGSLGHGAKIEVVLKTTNGYTSRKSLNIQPEAVDVSWEPQTYTPLFYKGHSRISPQSIIKVAAVSHFTTTTGAAIPSSSLLYTWSVNNAIVASGVGLNTTTITATYPEGTMDLSVLVTTINESLGAATHVTLQVDSPRLVLYENNPLSGVKYEHAITGTFEPTDTEVSVRAVPYFFSTPNILFSWALNGSNVGVYAPDIDLSKQSGVTVAKVSVMSQTSNFQLKNSYFRINFPEDTLTQPLVSDNTQNSNASQNSLF